MADTPTKPNGAEHVGGFLKATTAGLPNWAWLLVIGTGIVAAIIVPKIISNSTGAGNPSTTGTDTNGNSGIGLAVDPTTGLPYAVEGLVPSGGSNLGGGMPIIQPYPAPPEQSTPPVLPSPTQPKPVPQPAPNPQPQAQYVTVQSWPAPLSTLSGIAQANGLSLSRVEALNPQFGPSNGRDWNLIYPGEKVRIA